MEAAKSGGAVRCVGNVENIGSNVLADGMFINLRYQWTGEGYPGKDITFTVSGADFCDNQEERKPLSVANVVYKYIPEN